MIYPGTYSLILRESIDTRLSVEQMDDNFKFLNNLANSGGSGTSGTSGSNGADGMDGIDGLDGSSGTSGTSGANGFQGAPGNSGSSGTSGADGSSGTSGADGSSGTSGATGATGSTGIGFSWKGEWNPSYGTYSSGVDVVSDNGSTYIKISGSGNSGSAPSGDATRWALYTSKGATGPAGATGSEPTKTRGLRYGDPTTYSNYTELIYDINIIYDGVANSFFVLPNTTIVGKEVIVDVAGYYCKVYTQVGGSFETSVSGYNSQTDCNYNDLIKFTSTGANYWLVEKVSRVYPTLNGVSLVGINALQSAALYTGTASLSRATLNSTYLDYSHPLLGFSVYGPNIEPSGLVYVKTGTSSWVSLPITTVV